MSARGGIIHHRSDCNCYPCRARRGEHPISPTKGKSFQRLDTSNYHGKKSATHRAHISHSLRGKSKSLEQISKTVNTRKRLDNYRKPGEGNYLTGTHRTHSIATRKKMSQLAVDRILRHPTGRGFKLHYISKKSGLVLYCASTYEYQACRILDDYHEILKFNRCSFKIPYTYEGVNRLYVPDFFVELIGGRQVVLEVKSVWELQHKDTRAFVQSKIQALRSFCMDNGFEYWIWTEKELFCGE